MRISRRFKAVVAVGLVALAAVLLWPEYDTLRTALAGKSAEWSRRWREAWRTPVHLVLEGDLSGRAVVKENGKICRSGLDLSEPGELYEVARSLFFEKIPGSPAERPRVDSLEVRLPSKAVVSKVWGAWDFAVNRSCRLTATDTSGRAVFSTDYDYGGCEHCMGIGRVNADVVWVDGVSPGFDVSVASPDGGLLYHEEFNLPESMAVLSRVAATARENGGATESAALCLVLWMPADAEWGRCLEVMAKLKTAEVAVVYVAYEDFEEAGEPPATVAAAREVLERSRVKSARDFEVRLRARQHPVPAAWPCVAKPGRPAAR